MRRFSVALALALLSVPSAAPIAQKGATASKPVKFELTADSIMRGPDLVGSAPTVLRWSADSRQLYFDWRKPGEDESSSYAVSRDGGQPRKFTDVEAKNIPPSGGRWDKARKRVLFVDAGDVVLVDGSGARRQITRTAGPEASPRWARDDTHVTYVRDGNLFIVPIDTGAGALLTQLTDVGPKRPEPRLTDSQKFIRDEEEKLIEFLREKKEQKKKAEEKADRDKLPALELQERQSALDLMLSPDATHVFVVVAERPAGAKNTVVPNYVTETGYTEDIPGRSNVGDAQDRRLLAVLNLKTNKAVWADGSFAPPVPETEKPASTQATGPDQKPGAKAEREIRWAMPSVSSRGAVARRADVLHHEHRGPSRRAAFVHPADRWGRAHEGHAHERVQRGDRLARRVHDRARALLQQQAVRTVPDAESAGRGGKANHDHADRRVARVHLDRSKSDHVQGT